MQVQAATASDLDAVTETLVAAFDRDPLWRWAFPEGDGIETFWRFCVGSALRFPCTRFLAGYAAAAVWIPPGEEEFGPDEERQVGPLIQRLAGSRAGEILELLDRFEAVHPRERPHYHLTLFGTAPERRGAGLGMTLLRENLAAIDGEHMPAYLESSNPANDARYETVGFAPMGSFETPDGSHRVTTMWREARL
jgi:GNAT superfamily N-acetyltransferase